MSACLQILMTALEVICSLSECSENVADLVEAPYALDKIAALARYANTEMQVRDGIVSLLCYFGSSR